MIMLVAACGLYGYANATLSETEVLTYASSSTTSYKVRACEIKKNGNLWVNRMVDAYYDSDSNRLYVGEYSYAVSENSLYGNASDKRGKYKYVAGTFYFNA